MFFVSLHSTGGVAVLDTPLAYGPRHCGQKRSVGEDVGLDWGIAAPSATAHSASLIKGTSIGACTMTTEKGQERLRPERAAGGKRREAAPPSESERGWGPASSEKC